MIIDCIADLHGFFPKLDGGDLLIVAGDLTATDTAVEYMKFHEWIRKQKYKKIILIAGNHDNLIQKGFFTGKSITPEWLGFDYLLDSGIEFEGLKIWGSPWTKTFPGMNPHCKAFTFDTEDELADKFEKIPRDTDILITHSPPYSVLDKIVDGYSVGSLYLFNWFKYIERPKLHVFGHIHEAYGQAEIFPGYNDTMVKSVNASHVDELYNPVNKPIRIIL